MAPLLHVGSKDHSDGHPYNSGNSPTYSVGKDRNPSPHRRSLGSRE